VKEESMLGSRTRKRESDDSLSALDVLLKARSKVLSGSRTGSANPEKAEADRKKQSDESEEDDEDGLDE
jgi:hypothetical protein